MFKIVFFQHPHFIKSQSMPRFAKMLSDAFVTRGYEISNWFPANRLHKHFAGRPNSKWAGYIDQYVLFPRDVKKALRNQPKDTLYVFCDQALGPWVPLVADRPHIVHCHDFLALRSALGEIEENPTRLTGRIYQSYIRRGFYTSANFISVSYKTREDLSRFSGPTVERSEVVYNGLNPAYRRIPEEEAVRTLSENGLHGAPRGFLLNIGGAQWYKNREGLIRAYARYAAATEEPLPLLMIGPPPNTKAQILIAAIPKAGLIRFHHGLSDDVLAAAYSSAAALLFPSLAEGFGWPIAEALACGCPVITTDEAPMTEVGGDAAFYVKRMQIGHEEEWAELFSSKLLEVLAMSDAQRAERAERGYQWVKRFDSQAAFDAYEAIYRQVFAAVASQ